MKDLKEILDEYSGMRLNRFDYKRIEQIQEETNLYLQDEFQVLEVQEDFFALLIRRHIYCEPEDTMNIELEFEIARHLAEGYTEDLRKYDIESEVKKDVDYYIDYNMSRASALISAVTSSFGMSPLVTPPNFIERETEE